MFGTALIQSVYMRAIRQIGWRHRVSCVLSGADGRQNVYGYDWVAEGDKWKRRIKASMGWDMGRGFNV